MGLFQWRRCLWDRSDNFIKTLSFPHEIALLLFNSIKNNVENTTFYFVLKISLHTVHVAVNVAANVNVMLQLIALWGMLFFSIILFYLFIPTPLI